MRATFAQTIHFATKMKLISPVCLMKQRFQLLNRLLGSFSFFMCFFVLFFFSFLLKVIINLLGCDKENYKRDIGKDTLI